jgi:hypothetical protein
MSGKYNDSIQTVIKMNIAASIFKKFSHVPVDRDDEI